MNTNTPGDLPEEVLQAERTLATYFAERNITNWQLGNCAARTAIATEAGKWRKALQAYVALDEMRGNLKDKVYVQAKALLSSDGPSDEREAGEAKEAITWSPAGYNKELAVDATGKVRGEVCEHSIDPRWDARANDTRLGEYLTRDQAKAAVLAALAAPPQPVSAAVRVCPTFDRACNEGPKCLGCPNGQKAKPVSAEPDRYKRALEAIIANPGGASAKRIATLALGLDGTEQVSAEAGKGARDPDAACAPCGLCHQLDGHALNCPNSPSESVAVSGEVSEPAEKQLRLRALADRIDYEELWRVAGMHHHLLSNEQKDRMNAGVELRRYAQLWKRDCWTLFQPVGAVCFSAPTLDKVFEMAKRDEQRKAQR